MIPKIKISENGPELSRLILGLMRLNEYGFNIEQRYAWLQSCLELGMTSVDLADIYGGYESEALLGQLLKADKSLRDKLQIITKCGVKLLNHKRPKHRIKHYDSSAEHIVFSVEQSLKSLHTDYIDLLLIHRPDPLMEPVEVSKAFSDLKRAGKVRYFGVSNFSCSQFNLLNCDLEVSLVTNQLEISLAQLDAFENGVLDLCLQQKISPMAWSPLSNGRFLNSGLMTDQSIRINRELEVVKQSTGSDSIASVALAWLLKHPANILPILGSGNIERACRYL